MEQVRKPNLSFAEEIKVMKEISDELKQLFESFPNIVIVEGFLIFNHDELMKLCDLKFFATLDYVTCAERRKLRSYDPPDVPGYFDQTVYPYYIKNLADMTKLDANNQICYLDGRDSVLKNFEIIMTSLIKYLQCQNITNRQTNAH